jgi:23S rRNA G2445 N2-methylase RlmL
VNPLAEKLRGRGWQPSRAEAAALFEELATADRDQAELIERALQRMGREAASAAMRQFAASRPPARARLLRLVGRLAGASPDPELRTFLLAGAKDTDAKTRRNAVIALGKISGDPEVEAALRARWPEAAVEERRSLAEALGKIGGGEALALFESFATDDPELQRLVGEARLKLSRTLGRAGAGVATLDADALPPVPLEVTFHCRHGLAAIVAAEVEERLGPARIVDDERVSARLSASLASLYTVRTALRFAFPLAAGPTPDPGRAVEEALGAASTLALLRAFTRGALRYRIEWASGGHRRGLTFRTAQAIQRAHPELINDPTASTWEVIVDESHGLRLSLWPRGLADPRFAYRVEHVPASSHPTIAAALARVGGARPDDVVWDPFVGAGTELVERARRGPARRLVGTDLDERALELARTNLRAAGVIAELHRGDARSYRPVEPPTLILTNPPMGRRVLNSKLTGALFDEFLAHATQVAAPGARLVWLSPRAEDTAARARQLGWKLHARHRVDMAGFWAELQAFSIMKK